jgi:phage tail-like protein
MPQPPKPLGRHTFVLKIPEIDTIGFFLHCSGLELSFDVYEYHEGGNNDYLHRLPGTLRYPNLVLSRGLTNEDALLKWFWATQTQAERKQVTLTLSYADVTRTWTFGDAFPVRWTGPAMDSSAPDVATETLEIAHSGMQIA